MAQSHSSHQTNPGGASHGSLYEYFVGLCLSILLTVIPFAVVMSGSMGETVSIALILLCAVAQIMVQLIFFLHMNASSEQMWNSVSAVFVVLLVLILIIGSVWIMQHLNHNMLMGH